MRSLAAAVFLGLLAGPAGAAEPDACAAAHRSCIAQCRQSFPASRDDMGYAGCQARCSWDGASCATQRALDDTRAAVDRDLKPWLADQADKWQRFLDGFRRGGVPDGGAPRPAEPPRSRPDRTPGESSSTSL